MGMCGSPVTQELVEEMYPIGRVFSKDYCPPRFMERPKVRQVIPDGPTSCYVEFGWKWVVGAGNHVCGHDTEEEALEYAAQHQPKYGREVVRREDRTWEVVPCS